MNLQYKNSYKRYLENKEHWQGISDLEKKRMDKKILALEKEIKKTYDRAIANINKDIAYWYSKYAIENEVPIQAARKILDKGELAEFKMTLEEYIKHGRELAVDSSWLSAMESASERHHITRLNALKMQTQAELQEALAKWTGKAELARNNMVVEEYLRMHYNIAKDINVGHMINGADLEKLKIAANKAWTPDGIEFTERAGINNAKLVKTVQRELSQSCITGASYEQTAKRISDYIGIGAREAMRIVKTESTHLATLAEVECYHDLGISQYQYLASLDRKTCEICAFWDGYVDKVSNLMEGENAPPMHPNCRCTTIPYYGDDFGETRAARDNNGKTIFIDSNISYSEWKYLCTIGVFE